MSIEQTPSELATESISDETRRRAAIFSSDAERDDDYDPASEYRALSSSAVAALALGLLSPLAIFDWWLGLIPLTAVILGIVALRTIRTHQGEYTGAGMAIAGTVLAVLFWIGGFAHLSYIYATEVPEGFERIDYSILQPLPDEPPDRVPPDAKSLDGKKVFIKGYVYPGQRQYGITQFLLVRDQGSCCFGGNPKLTDRILVQLSDPEGLAFSSKLFKLAGTFHVTDPRDAPDAKGVVFYHLDDAQLR
jgi:hypothetical protein